eukprot:8285215-Alexandrium_andersonii.AAC.1
MHRVVHSSVEQCTELVAIGGVPRLLDRGAREGVLRSQPLPAEMDVIPELSAGAVDLVSPAAPAR